MSYSIAFFHQASQDVKAAKAWYKEQQPGLEKRFANAIKAAIIKLQERPYAFAVRYKNIRIVRPKNFPYCIHFYIDEINQQIVIMAIVHNRRHPDVAGTRNKDV